MAEYYAVRRLRLRFYALLFMLAGLACLAFIGCASSGSLKVAQAGFVAAQVADLHSTELALSRGAVEANPLMQGSSWQRVALKAASTAGVFWAGRTLESRGHRAVAVVATAALATAMAIISGHNYSIAWGR
jgi:hypothetical protein